MFVHAKLPYIRSKDNSKYLPVYVMAHAWYKPGKKHKRLPVWSIFTRDPTNIAI